MLVEVKMGMIYRLADGRMWDVEKAAWLDPEEVATLTAGQNINAVSDNAEADAPLITPDPIMEQNSIIQLSSSDGKSDVAYLVKTLAFYNYPLGDLIIYSPKEIREELARLDAEYLTPRTLAGLTIGDEIAIARYAEHEDRAAPLRERLKELES